MLSWGFAERIGVDFAISYGAFVFFGTFSVYNLQRIFKVSRTPLLTPWLVWVRDNRGLIITLSTLSSMGALVSLWFVQPFNTASVSILAVAAVFGLFYVVRINGRNLRAIPFFKIHAISITWSLLIAVFPLVNGEKNLDVIPVFIAHYLYILAVTIPFDIRDLKYDDDTFKTIPQVLGAKGAKRLALFFLMGYILTSLFIVPDLLLSPWFYGVILFTGALIAAVNEKVSDWYCAGLIDGSISLLGLVYLLVS